MIVRKSSTIVGVYNKNIVVTSVVVLTVQMILLLQPPLLLMLRRMCYSLHNSNNNNYYYRHHWIRPLSPLPPLLPPPGRGTTTTCRMLMHSKSSITTTTGIEPVHNNNNNNSNSNNNNNSSNHHSDTSISTLSLCKSSSSFVHESQVQKSRFVAYAQHVETWSEAQDYIQSIRREHPQARHWCYACCCIAAATQQERSSDDGEPKGTAGRPILNAIRHEGLSDTVCVVVRYFGGIQLGTGGLIRAYGHAARQVLRMAPRTRCIAQSTWRIRVDTRYIGTIYDLVAKNNGRCSGEEYDATTHGCLVVVTIQCETSQRQELERMLLDATRGTATFLK
jgi:uncharacterized YigZ family protein